MKKTKLFTALGLSGTLFIAGAALATGQEHSMNFDALDENQDGTLTYSEAQESEVIQDNWDAVDSDQDGTVDRIEFSAFEAEQSMEMRDESQELPDESPEKGDDPGYDGARQSFDERNPDVQYEAYD